MQSVILKIAYEFKREKNTIDISLFMDLIFVDINVYLFKEG